MTPLTALPWWPLLSILLTVAAGGIVTFFVTRATARRAVRDELTKRQQGAAFEARRAWLERTATELSDFLEVQQAAIAELGKPPEQMNMNVLQGRMREAFASLRRSLVSAALHAPPDVVAEILHLTHSADGFFVDALAAQTIGERTELGRRGMEQLYQLTAKTWSAVVVASREHLGAEQIEHLP